MGKIVSLCNIKGGTGKTTIACHLTYYLALCTKSSVGFIDCDRQNLSSFTWLTGSDLQTRLTCLGKVDGEEQLFEELQKYKSESDVLVLDTQSGLSDVNKTVLSISDLVIIPLQPHILDFDSSLKIVRHIANLKNFTETTKPKVLVLLNRCVPRTNLTSEAEKYLRASLPESFIPIKIYQRQVYADAPMQKDFVFKLDSQNPKAKNEIHNLCSYIHECIKGE